jgi:hypothetical protein
VGPKGFVVACLLALPLAACGSGARADDAAAVSERFHAALESGDAKAACADLGEETLSSLEQQEGKPCEQSILSMKIPKGGSAAARQVAITSAYVRLKGGSSDFLDEGPGGWKISAAGCRPSPSPEQPQDCEVEG